MTAAQLTQAALVLGIVGALAVAYGAGLMILADLSYQGPTDVEHRREKWATLIGAVLVAVAFALQLAATLIR